METIHLIKYVQIIDTIQIIQRKLSSDILSYHKEIRRGEASNYVKSTTRSMDKPKWRLLLISIGYTKGVFDRVGTVLGAGRALEAFKSMVAGLAQYHLNTKRCMLDEILREDNVSH